MGNAICNAEFEALIDRLRGEHRLGGMKTAELVREVDVVISALRTIVARRLEVAIDPYWQSLETRYATSMADDPGLVAINEAIEAIAVRAGYTRPPIPQDDRPVETRKEV